MLDMLRDQMIQSVTEGVLLVAHGTIAQLDELPAFLTAIRRGRPPSDALLGEMRRRYAAIGGSPLLATTTQQASLLAHRIARPVLVGMRFGSPSIEQALREAEILGIRQLVVLPMAPYSVALYAGEVRARYASIRGQSDGTPMQLRAIPPWGTHPQLLRAHAELVRSSAGDTMAQGASVALSAHSLPMSVIESGDAYAEQIKASARGLEELLGVEVRLGFQSQGADGGRWLGPDLSDVVHEIAAQGTKRIVVVPFGFLCDHVETLYDLDVELKQQTNALGVELCRVPALGTHPQLIDTLVELVGSALSVPAEAHAC